ncbi:protein regulator of cytokinesis 1-like [Stegodyphus dumicola]|uniref:protein regulator of cytokinesis 1-like n=1 Tax=Stegodyphus dumicola TaxID=202533 RepID=UPI0015ACC59E|nr:protein regulator of cytokinesis 1-like [Stegodyphus dumicola]XP_035212871.1 protein regulator of cytokinesis 1-like [Stegodyphus dumicola]XP_035212872.1 protein regulator of cytokinesis 1-like [Stegodyphus dumicola]
MNRTSVAGSASEETILEKIKNDLCLKIESSFNKLSFIWNEFGIDGEQKSQRAKVVSDHIQNLLRDIIEEENGFYEDIKQRIQNYKKQILELAQLLNIPANDVVEGSLIQTEERLRIEVENLFKLKHKRIKAFKDLRSEESKYCKRLGLPPLNISTASGLASEKDMHELQQHITMLILEKDKRLKKYYSFRKELTTILETTEMSPETSLEKNIISGKEDSILLSDETMKALEDIVCKVQNKKAGLEARKKELMDKLTTLWQRLNVNEYEKELFLSQHADCRVKTIESIEKEVQKYEEIKKQNIQSYVENLRKELEGLWDRCFVSETQRQQFHPFTTMEFNDEILEAHDMEVEKWRSFYKDTENIVNKIAKRQKLWDLLIAFENKSSDPNRYKNRGGNLLQEEKERRRLQRDLPALENEIFNDIEEYEAQKGKPFLYFGLDFREFINRQWEDRINQKENEKIMRHKMRSQIGNETTLRTPGKRLLPGTPKSAPSKLFKSGVGVSVFRTPNVKVLKTTPNTVGKLHSRTDRLANNKKSQNSIVQAKCQKKIQKGKNQHDKTAVSGSSNDTTYTQFAAELNKSSRNKHRSSVLSSRKLGGTRISQNNSQRRSKKKSAAKSFGMSLRNTTRTSAKLTPARGKLGLPFLI